MKAIRCLSTRLHPLRAGGHPAVDEHDLSGDEARGWRGEEHDSPGELPRGPKASQRDAPDHEPGESRIRRLLLRQLGWDKARGNPVDDDAVLPPFGRKLLDQVVDAALCGGVCGESPLSPGDAARGGKMDDPPALLLVVHL